MTLIIGARFQDGVILVSDRKVTDLTGNAAAYEKKLQTPLNISLVFGAAGYSHKFKQFNRLILDVVDQRLREIRVKNIAFYQEHDIEYKETMPAETKIENLTTQELKKEAKKEDNLQSEPITPDVYLYTHESFIKDCSQLIRQLCVGADGIARPDLDVLLGIHSRNKARIHRIDFLGEEVEVDYCAIGSGSSYVENFMKNFWRENMTINEIISLCFFCIYYVQELNLDNGVGVEPDKIPDHQVVTHDGVLGFWVDLKKNKDVILGDIKKKLAGFKQQIDELKF